MNNFVGRKKELNILENRYNSESFEFGYLYGQRRIGKTSLLDHFQVGKKSLLLFATDSEDADIRDSFTKELSKKTGITYGAFKNWYEFFEAVDDYFKNDKGILVIDEYPNIMLTRDGKRKRTDFPSMLQKAIDNLYNHRKFTLVITGSNISLMEKEMNDNNAPLYQRNTFSLLLKKLEWDEAIESLKGISNKKKAEFLSLTNTFPYYLSLIDKNASLDDNLLRLFYGVDAIFTDDPSKIITSDKATGGLYASLIKHISLGRNTIDELCKTLDIDSSKMNKYVKELINDNILKRIGNFNSNRNIKLEIIDPMLTFYYRFIRENVENIKRGYGELIKKEQENSIKDFFDHQFENICVTYLEYLDKNSQLDALYIDFYSFTVDHSKLGRSVQIDVLGASNSHLLIGECKYSKNPRTIKDFFDMKEDTSIEVFNQFHNKEYYLFGASGFTKELLDYKDEHLHLIDLDKMFGE